MKGTLASLRYWPVVEALHSRVASGVCGELASLRLQWMRPRSMRTAKTPLPALLDAAAWIAGAGVKKLGITQRTDGNDCFAVVEFQNEVIAEIEINESLPDTMRAAYFVKGNFSHGHAGNQPLAGYGNADGALLADAESCRMLQIDNVVWEPFEDEIELAWARAEFYHAPEVEPVFYRIIKEAEKCL